MKTQSKKSRFSHIALALALSLGTVGGMASFLALTETAQARGNGGGGGGAGGAEGGNGGEPAANAGGPRAAINRAPPVINPPIQQPIRSVRLTCDGSRETIDNQNCRHNARSTPRIVRINGFANCAIVQQIPSPNGGPAEFYCVRPM